MPSRPPNVICLVLDSVRRDALSCYGGAQRPFLDELAESGTKVERAYATGSWTVPVHGSLFTGRFPTEHGARAGQERLSISAKETLAGHLSEMGYETAGFSTNPWIRPEFEFDKGFGTFEYIEPSVPFNVNDDNPRDQSFNHSTGLAKRLEIARWIMGGNSFRRFVNAVYASQFINHPISDAATVNDHITSWLKSTTGPFFLFANYMDAHEPYRIREQYFPSDAPTSDALNFEWNLRSLNNGPDQKHEHDVRSIYEASVTYLDEKLRELYEFLEHHSMLDNTLVIVLGDHGQSLGEHGYWGHGTFLYESLVAVPLLIDGPESSVNIGPDSRPVSVADVPRLVGDVVGRPFDEFRKHTLSTEPESEDDLTRPVLVESYGSHEDVDIPSAGISSGYRALYKGPWRLFHDLDEGYSVKDVTTEDGESTAIPEEIQTELIDLEQKILSNLEEKATGSNEVPDAVSDQLERLGYM